MCIHPKYWLDIFAYFLRTLNLYNVHLNTVLRDTLIVINKLYFSIKQLELYVDEKYYKRVVHVVLIHLPLEKMADISQMAFYFNEVHLNEKFCTFDWNVTEVYS